MARSKIKSSTDERPFFLVYQDFLNSDVLDTADQKLLFIILKSFANKQNTCFPSLQKLSKISKLSKRKVQSTLKELESKGVLKVEKRVREDGGLSSNLYTLYDFKELWSSVGDDEIATAIDDFEEHRMIKLLKAKGYSITKEKELVSVPAKVTETSPAISSISSNNYKKIVEKSQESVVNAYNMEVLKALYEYKIMIFDHPDMQQDIDVVMNILYDTLNTKTDTIRINRENKPASVVKAKLLKLNSSHILYVIKKYKEQTEKINNPEGYIITLLYKASEQMHLDINNQVMHDLSSNKYD
jgi:DNA-binding HxlR family transcriptional regulator|nr:MAG TPA: helix-turn-helix domain protein [Inoviridae sp.]